MLTETPDPNSQVLPLTEPAVVASETWLPHKGLGKVPNKAPATTVQATLTADCRIAKPVAEPTPAPLTVSEEDIIRTVRNIPKLDSIKQQVIGRILTEEGV